MFQDGKISKQYARPVSPQLTLFSAGSPVSRFPLPGTEQAQQMTATSGRRCLRLFEHYNPGGSLVRMFLVSNRWSSRFAFLTWKASATTSAAPGQKTRLIWRFRLWPRVLTTEGCASGLLPTPVANDDNKSPEAHMSMKASMKGGPRHKPTSLQVYAKAGLLPTTLSDVIYDQEHGTKRRLNPQFVAWMMRAPTWWANSKATETASMYVQRMKSGA